MVISWREVFFPGSPKILDFWGEEEKRSAASLRPGMRLSLAKPSLPNATATVSEGADRPERSAGKKTFDNRILILRRFKRRFGSESNPSAKVLLFSDMAMGWSGLRAVLVRIACMCPNDWAKQEKKVEKKHKE